MYASVIKIIGTWHTMMGWGSAEMKVRGNVSALRQNLDKHKDMRRNIIHTVIRHRGNNEIFAYVKLEIK